MSSSRSSQQTQTSSSVSAVDRRLGVTGEGNVTATEGGNVSVTNNDLSADALDMLVRGNAFVSEAALVSAAESSRQAASVAARAIDATSENSRVAISGVLTGQDRSLDTADRAISAAAASASDVTSTARQIALSNNALTETTRQGNQELVKLVADKLSTSVADERKNINATLVETISKYGTVALVAVALVTGIVLYSRRKAS